MLIDPGGLRIRAQAQQARPEPGAQRGGQDRGSWYYGNLAIYISNYAKGAYEDFDGEPDVQVDAVDLTTVHKAKGLEWRVVFVPSLTKSRFPSSKTGRPRDWLVPRHLFNPERYEGTDADERRLFYVAMTRARDWLSLSRHERVTKNRVVASNGRVGYWNSPNACLAAVQMVAGGLVRRSGVVPSLLAEAVSG